MAAVSLAVCASAFAQAPAKPAKEPSRFEIRRFVFEGATLLPLGRLDAQTRPFTGSAKTFADVQKALEAVERAYSDAGWSAVQVVLPEQKLERGEVRLRIIEAHIGRIIVEGNRFFDEANIRASVPALVPGKAPNIKQIARNLRVANENPAKQAQLLLRSGGEEATVDAVLRVVDENPAKRSLTVDNSGSPQTGRVRVGFGYRNGNLSGIDDVLSLQYVTAPYEDHLDADNEPDRYSLLPSRKVTILGAAYRVPLYESGDSIDLSAGYSNVNSGIVADLFRVTGAGTLFDARYNANLDKIGDYEHRLVYSLDWRTYDDKGVRAPGSSVQPIADVTVHPLGVTYVGVYRLPGTETAFSLGFFKNVPGGNDGTAADFCKPLLRTTADGMCARSSYELWKWSIGHNQALPGDVRLHVALNGQFTRDMLVPGEQFGVGGADSVRGFLEREIADDKGYRGTLEAYGPDFGGKTGIARARMRALTFLDWAHVRRNHPGPGEFPRQDIGSWGIGLRAARGSALALRVDIAVVLDEGANREEGSTRLHAGISYVF